MQSKKSNSRIIKINSFFVFNPFLIISIYFLLNSYTKSDSNLIQNSNKHNQKKIDTTQYAFIDGNAFKMGLKNGDSDEKKIHKVIISSFYIGKKEISNSEFAGFLNSKGMGYQDHIPWIDLNGKWRNEKCRIYRDSIGFCVENGYEDFPVTFVSWYGAKAYADWIGGRLPTEAEWEYVASKIKNHDFANIAWYKDNADYQIRKTATKLPHYKNIFDFFGNAGEWCEDWYQADFYKTSPKHNPVNNKRADYKVYRGGSFINEQKTLRSSKRFAFRPNNHSIQIGFRVVMEIN